MTVVMSFAGAPAAGADATGDGNAGEDDQAAGVSGVQAEPQVAVGSGDQAQPQSLQEFVVNKQQDLLMYIGFPSKIPSWENR